MRDVAAEWGIEPCGPTRGCPRSKRAKVEAVADSVERERRFETLAGKVSMLRRSDLSLKCIASGISYLAAFCDMSGGRHFPRTEKAALSRSAGPLARRTCQGYLV